MPWFYEESDFISGQRKEKLIERFVFEARERISKKFKKVLLIPPDLTRYHSGTGSLTEIIYNMLSSTSNVDVLPALGQHFPHTDKENKWMFGSIPSKNIYAHDWKNGCKKLGEVSADYVSKVTEGKVDWPLPISINRMVFEGGYDLIVNIGQVVPHEVIGFANHNKNYFSGLGSKETIDSSHMFSACWGIERTLGRIMTPLRMCFNKAEDDFLGGLKDVYILVVIAKNRSEKFVTTGFYVGDDFDTYLLAAKRSKAQNITILDEPVKKIVAYMDAEEFRSAWLANKAIYRTRMAIADGGELLVIAPGLETFGEKKEIDELIRKYGYVGTEKIMQAYKSNNDLKDSRSAAAHLIHGSSEGRFTITYAPGKMSREEIEKVNFRYMDINEAMSKYNPDKLKDGWNKMPDGEDIYYISAPAMGLWACRSKLNE
jgi:nickel-dependent lactate racemase